MNRFEFQLYEDELRDKVESYANRIHPDTGKYPTDEMCDAYEAKLRQYDD